MKIKSFQAALYEKVSPLSNHQYVCVCVCVCARPQHNYLHIKLTIRSWFSEPHPLLLPHRQSEWGVKLTTHLHLLLSLRMGGKIPPLPHVPSWRALEQLYLT
jgi:hypothetical protein